MWRKAALAIIALLPWRLKRLALIKGFGHVIHPEAFIGVSYLDVDHMILEKGARIGYFNFFRSISRLSLGSGAQIGNLNWFTALSSKYITASPHRNRELIIGLESAITNRHYFDLQDRIEIGAFTTVAGVRSTFFTHQIDIVASHQSAAGIAIGNYCFVSSNCVVLAGSTIGEKIVVAAGSVVKGTLPDSCTLYGGVPARMLRRMDESAKYFARTQGSVS